MFWDASITGCEVGNVDEKCVDVKGQALDDTDRVIEGQALDDTDRVGCQCAAEIFFKTAEHWLLAKTRRLHSKTGRGLFSNPDAANLSPRRGR
jgi:hypothetical protein